MPRPRGYPSNAHLREARRVRVSYDRTGAFTRGNVHDTNTARTTVLAADQPTSWSGRYDYWPTGAPRVSVPKGQNAAAHTAPTRSAVHHRARRIGLDMDTLSAGQLRKVLRTTVARVGVDRWRHMGADARERELALTVNSR